MAKSEKTTTAKNADKGVVAKDKVKTEDVNVPMAPTITYDMAEINKVMNYLGNRPYVEVAGLIQIMQSGKSS